jgi:hypothetical protein
LSVGYGTITDSTVSGQLPRYTNVNSTYLSQSRLNSTSTYYPTGITCDTSGKLYVVMGYTAGTPVGSNILVFNGTTKTKTIDFSTTFNPATYGYNLSVTWNSNALYIGTYIGSYTTSITGNIFAYNTVNDSVQTFSPDNTYNSFALVVYNSYLVSVNSNGFGSVLIYTNLLYLFVKNVTSTSFNFNFHGIMIDISNILINSTNNINNIANTKYNVNSDNTNFELGILYQNSATRTNDTIRTNYYILVEQWRHRRAF